MACSYLLHSPHIIINMRAALLILALLLATRCQQQPQQDTQLDDQQSRYFQDYAKHMVGFQPEQSFILQLKPFEFQQFVVLVRKGGNTFRGLFYIDGENSSDRILLSAWQHKQLFMVNNQRMHVFNTNDTQQGSITMQIKNTDANPKTVYFSYETLQEGKTNDLKATNEHFKPLLEQYTQLMERVQRRDFMLRTLIKTNEQHTRDLAEQRNRAVHYAIFQTIILTGTFAMTLLFVYRTVRRKSYSVI